VPRRPPRLGGVRRAVRVAVRGLGEELRLGLPERRLDAGPDQPRRFLDGGVLADRGAAVPHGAGEGGGAHPLLTGFLVGGERLGGLELAVELAAPRLVRVRCRLELAAQVRNPAAGSIAALEELERPHAVLLPREVELPIRARAARERGNSEVIADEARARLIG